MKKIRWRNGRRSIGNLSFSIRNSGKSRRSLWLTRLTYRMEDCAPKFWRKSCPRLTGHCISSPPPPPKECRCCGTMSGRYGKTPNPGGESLVTQLDYKRDILHGVGRVVVKIGSQILFSAAGIEEARLKSLV